jgi:hypothetical protein
MCANYSFALDSEQIRKEIKFQEFKEISFLVLAGISILNIACYSYLPGDVNANNNVGYIYKYENPKKFYSGAVILLTITLPLDFVQAVKANRKIKELKKEIK